MTLQVSMPNQQLPGAQEPSLHQIVLFNEEIDRVLLGSTQPVTV